MSVCCKRSTGENLKDYPFLSIVSISSLVLLRYARIGKEAVCVESGVENPHSSPPQCFENVRCRACLRVAVYQLHRCTGVTHKTSIYPGLWNAT